MGDRSGIAWTNATWNMIRAIRAADTVSKKLGWMCVRVSAGCTNCYAAQMNGWRGNGEDYTVPGLARVTPFLDEKALTLPLRWRSPRRIFVCSMTDLFGEWVPDEWIDRIFAVMALAPQHTFQVLTKRPERMLAYLSDPNVRDHVFDAATKILQARSEHDIRALAWDLPPWPLPNIWPGASVEDQATADERISLLLQTPAAMRFVSYEPGLAGVDFRLLKHSCYAGTGRPHPDCEAEHGPKLDWVIVGGESGSGARPFDLAWARSAIAQCRAAGVPCFVKQIGARPFSSDPLDGVQWHKEWAAGPRLRDRKGGDPSDWPADLRVREYHAAAAPAQLAARR